MVGNSRVSKREHTAIPIKRGVSHVLGLLATRPPADCTPAPSCSGRRSSLVCRRSRSAAARRGLGAGERVFAGHIRYGSWVLSAVSSYRSRLFSLLLGIYMPFEVAHTGVRAARGQWLGGVADARLRDVSPTAWFDTDHAVGLPAAEAVRSGGPSCLFGPKPFPNQKQCG